MVVIRYILIMTYVLFILREAAKDVVEKALLRKNNGGSKVNESI